MTTLICCVKINITAEAYWLELPVCFQHIVEQDGNTRLPQYLGMYRITINDSDTYFIVMRNIFSPRILIHRKYDLKVCLLYNCCSSFFSAVAFHFCCSLIGTVAVRISLFSFQIHVVQGDPNLGLGFMFILCYNIFRVTGACLVLLRCVNFLQYHPE